jgi:spermidine/putrescine transport system permease protein
MAMPGIVAALALVGILAIGEFTVPAILGGGKTLLIGNVLAEQAGGANRPLGGAIAVVLLVIFGFLGGLALLVRRRLRRADGVATV